MKPPRSLNDVSGEPVKYRNLRERCNTSSNGAFPHLIIKDENSTIYSPYGRIFEKHLRVFDIELCNRSPTIEYKLPYHVITQEIVAQEPGG
jgi:hypothetical protein